MTVTFKEWALDVTMAKYSGTVAFVPVIGDEVYWGHTIIQERCPGTLTSVVSQNGIDDVIEWVGDNPNWMVDFCNAADLAEATLPPENS